MPVVVVQDSDTVTESVLGVQMQRFSYTKRIRVFDATSVDDGAEAAFAQGTHWIEGSYTGLMVATAVSPPSADLLKGTLSIDLNGAASGSFGVAETAMVLHTSVMYSGNFMNGGPCIVQVQFRGTDQATA